MVSDGTSRDPRGYSRLALICYRVLSDCFRVVSGCIVRNQLQDTIVRFHGIITFTYVLKVTHFRRFSKVINNLA